MSEKYQTARQDIMAPRLFHSGLQGFNAIHALSVPRLPAGLKQPEDA